MIDIAELLARTPLLSVIGRRVTLRRRGRLLQGLCPFHGEKTPSFTVYHDHFHCFGCGAHGNAIGFTMRAEGLDFADAVDRLAAEAGMDRDELSREDWLRRDRAAAEARRRADEAREAAQSAEDAEAIAYVRRRLRRTVAIAGTIAERYLVATRRVPLPAHPDALRFDPQRRALVAVATDEAGEAQAAQWIYLTDDGRKLDAEALARRKLPAGKQTFGVLNGAAVRLPGLHPGPLYVVEGPEDAASLWASTGGDTWAALGGFTNINLPLQRPVVICADDDDRHKPGVRKAAAKWRAEGVDFMVVRPWPIRREDGSDFNDLLAAHGTGAVEQRVLDALEPGYRAAEPKELGIIRWRTARTIETLANAAARDDDQSLPPALLLAPAGSGKTEAGLREAVKLIRTLRVADDQRNVAVANPRHELSEEEARRVLAMSGAGDLKVHVLRGHDAIDPADAGHKMCRNQDLFMDAVTRRLDAKKAACTTCALSSQCGLRRQDGLDADIWLVTHMHTLNRKSAQLGKIAWLIIDEDPSSSSTFGVGDTDDPSAGDKPVLLRLSALRRGDPVKSDPEKTQRLAEFNAPLAEALWTAPDGPMQLATLHAAGTTADAAEQSIGLEYDTEVQPEFTPGLSREDVRALLKTADINRDLGARVMLKREIARQLKSQLNRNPRVEICTIHDEDGTHRAVRLMGKRELRAGWKDIPTIIMSATAQPELLRHMFHDLTVHEFGTLTAPHQYVRQVVDRAYSLSMLDAEAADEAKERRRRQRNLRDLHAGLYRKALEYAPHEVLVVLQKRLIPQLLKFGPLPDNVVMRHHGALTGLDRFGQVRAIVVVGRQQPRPAALERMAEALCGHPVERLPVGKWYPLRDAKRERASGELVLTEAEFHPDPLVEALRWRSCEAELVQIVARGRGAERTAENPLDVWLLTNVPLPLPLDEFIYSEDLRPRAEDLMVAQLGRMFENWTDAARLMHPGLDEAGIARKAATLRQRVSEERQRYGSDWRPPAGLVRATYRKAASGARYDGVWIEPAKAATLAAGLTALLGPLAKGPEIASSGGPIDSLPMSGLTERRAEEAPAEAISTGLTEESHHQAERPP